MSADLLFVSAALLLGAGSLMLVLLVRGRTALVGFAVALPVIHLLGDIGKGTQPTEVFHTGNIGVVLHTGFVLFCILRLQINALSVVTLAFVTYLAALIPFSAYPFNSLGAFLKVFAAFMLLPIGCGIFASVRELRRLQMGMLAALYLALLHFTVAQVFQIGENPYAQGTIYLAGGGVYITYLIAYVLAGIPLTLALLPPGQKLTRLFIALGALYGFIIVLVVFRRGTLLGFGLGLVTYFLLTSKFHRRRMIRYGVIAVAAAAITAPFYLPKLIPVIGLKGNVVRYVSETDRGRMAEFGLSIRMFSEGSIEHKLFGTNLFSSKESLGMNRALHVDYTNLLVTAGLIGLLLYFAVFVVAIMVFRHDLKAIQDVRTRRILSATFMAFLALFFSLSLSRQLGSMTSLTTGFLALGGVMGITRALGGRALPGRAPRQPARRAAPWPPEPRPRGERLAVPLRIVASGPER